MKRFALATTIALAATLLPALPAAAACPAPGGGTLPAAPEVDADIVFTGGGWGHGTGMSQYGAFGAAELGCSHTEILSTYYPGTTMASRASEGLRVSMATDVAKTTVRSLVRDVRWQLCNSNGSNCAYLDDTIGAAGLQKQGSTWIARVVQNTAAPSQTTASILIQKQVDGNWVDVHRHTEGGVVRVVLASVNRPERGAIISLDGRSLARGVVEIDPTDNGTDKAFVTLLIGMEQYLYGLSEVSSSRPAAALQAQAVAARSYAYQRKDTLASKRWAECQCDLYATTKDQHYVGWAKEYEVVGNTNYGDFWVAAVDATSEKILTWDGKPIPAFYSSVHGGSSESYKFWSGGSDLPYLKAVDDSAWEAAAKAPLSAWTLGVSAADLGKALGIGTVTGVTVDDPRGARGRVGRPDAGYAGVVVTGTSGTWKGSGDQLRSALRTLGNDCWDRTGAGAVKRLCSTLFDVQVNLGPRPVDPPSGAVRLTGDWDGDGVDTPGWFKDGAWGLHSAHSGVSGATQELQYGQAGDIPVVGDWDGDGIDSIGVVRPTSDGRLRWLLRNKYVKGDVALDLYYGVSGDVPVTGDWDGDGDDTIGVVRAEGQRLRWILRNRYVSGNTALDMYYGVPGDTAVAGDWDADGDDTIGVARAEGDRLRWILRNRYVSGNTALDMYYGAAGDRPVTGDWDGDATGTIGIVRGDRWILRSKYVKTAKDLDYRY